jgi:hypothetical protein
MEEPTFADMYITNMLVEMGKEMGIDVFTCPEEDLLKVQAEWDAYIDTK